MDDSGSEDDALTMEIHDLRMQKNLREKEFQCIYDAKETEKWDNEKQILQLRKENMKLREAYAECIRGDQKVINDVFRKRGRAELLQMQNSRIGPAIEELDDKLSRHYMELDSIRHVQRRRIRDLQRVTDEVNDLRNMADTKYECQLQQIINVRNNEIDKAAIKAETATKISRCYKKIYHILHDEVNGYPSRIEQLEKKLKKETTARDAAQEACDEATTIQGKSLGELSELEKVSFNERRQRDLTLQKTKKEVEERFRGVDLGEKKVSFRPQQTLNRMVVPFGLPSAVFDKKNASAERIDQQPHRQVHILSLTDDFDKIKDSIMVSDVDEVLKRFEEQSNTHKHLRWQKKTLSQRLSELRGQLKDVEGDLTNLKYSADGQDASARRELEQMGQYSLELDEKKEEKRLAYEGAEGLWNKVQIAVLTLYDKLSDIKLKPPHHNYSTGDPLTDLQNCQEKLEFILSEIQAIEDPSVLYCCLSPDRRAGFMNFIEGRLPAENTRFKPETNEGESMEEDGYYEEPGDRFDYLSNEDIKAKGQKMIELKTSRKRKKE